MKLIWVGETACGIDARSDRSCQNALPFYRNISSVPLNYFAPRFPALWQRFIQFYRQNSHGAVTRYPLKMAIVAHQTVH